MPAKTKRPVARKFIAAAVQMQSSDDPEQNLDTALRRITEASSNGARFVALPENFLYMRPPGCTDRVVVPFDGMMMRRIGDMARQRKIFLLAGTVPEPAGKLHYNTSVLYGPDGQAAAVYRKIHLFDIDLPGERHRESDHVKPGREVVTASTPLGTFGLSVCYDMRFPELFRRMALGGAEILCVPAAFTVPTGKAHWETLLRARAIENLCHVVAPGQCGVHPGGRRTWGHSVIIGPWGNVLARAGSRETIIYAEIDSAARADIRSHLPALSHARLLPKPR